MTATSMLPERPPSRVRHSWRCTRAGPLVEVVRPDPLGRNRVVEQCQECGHDDMVDRVRDRAAGAPPPPPDTQATNEHDEHDDDERDAHRADHGDGGTVGVTGREQA